VGGGGLACLRDWYASTARVTRKPVVEVRRSQRRRRTVSAYRDGERVVVLIPAQFSRAEEREWVDRMLERLHARDERTRRTDRELQTRAARLIARYLADHVRMAQPANVRWVTNQHGRWGSCTPADRTIRLSRRVQDMPDWVIDYVLLHELVHLVVPSHNPQFWALVARYPKAERARGYLEGVSAAGGLGYGDE
jgi:predicted metal-dependent hydrolase